MRQLIRVQVPAWAPLSQTLTTVAGATVVMLSRAVSSVGQSASLTPRRSLVRAQYRPPLIAT